MLTALVVGSPSEIDFFNHCRCCPNSNCTDAIHRSRVTLLPPILLTSSPVQTCSQAGSAAWIPLFARLSAVISTHLPASIGTGNTAPVLSDRRWSAMNLHLVFISAG